jgi:ribosome-associated protein
MAIQPNIDALLSECRFEATRSSGAGGQNVNKVSTKVILLFNVLESNVLKEDQKEQFMIKFSSRISKEGIFRISSGVERTQLGNRKRVVEKFFKLVEKAFKTDEERIATKPSASSKLKRIEGKKEVSGKKSIRSQKWDEEMDG